LQSLPALISSSHSPERFQQLAHFNKEEQTVIIKMVLCASLFVLGASQESSQNPQPKRAPAETEGTEEKEINGVKLLPIEANIVSYTNEERVKRGLPPLEVDKELMLTAREHCSWMTRNRSMVHTRRSVAENIAMGQPHSADVVRTWMNSSGHRANILNAGHLRIGVAAYRTENGTIFWCQQFRR
jgi:uncharacterized protein YkwD